jgi:hypothetical protein
MIRSLKVALSTKSLRYVVGAESLAMAVSVMVSWLVGGHLWLSNTAYKQSEVRILSDTQVLDMTILTVASI